jgi:hypothetical protein
VKVLFGMLTQPEEGAWYLEDLGSIIRLDLTRAQTYNVFFTEGSQVVVQGELADGVFRVQVCMRCNCLCLVTGAGVNCEIAVDRNKLLLFSVYHQVMGTPPAEERAATLKAIGVDDVFGSGIRPQQMLHLQELEAAQTDQLLVILSDVQLDKPLVSARKA